MAEPDVEETVTRHEHFEAAPDVLWDAITDPDLLAEWFGPVEIDLTPGAPITNNDDHHGGGVGEGVIGVVEAVEPPRRIGFVWIAPGSDAPSSVELVIDDDDGGSVLHVRETRIQPRWDTRPAWFASTPRAAATAGARA